MGACRERPSSWVSAVLAGARFFPGRGPVQRSPKHSRERRRRARHPARPRAQWDTCRGPHRSPKDQSVFTICPLAGRPAKRSSERLPATSSFSDPALPTTAIAAGKGMALSPSRSVDQARLFALVELLQGQLDEPLGRNFARLESVHDDAVACVALLFARGIGDRPHAGVDMGSVRAERQPGIERLP